MRQIILHTSSPFVFSAMEAARFIDMPLDAEIAIKADKDLQINKQEGVAQVEVPVNAGVVHPSSDLVLELQMLPEFAHEGLKLLWFYPFTKENQVIYMAGLDTSGLASNLEIKEGEYLFAGRYQNKVNVRVIRD